MRNVDVFRIKCHGIMYEFMRPKSEELIVHPEQCSESRYLNMVPVEKLDYSPGALAIFDQTYFVWSTFQAILETQSDQQHDQPCTRLV